MRLDLRTNCRRSFAGADLVVTLTYPKFCKSSRMLMAETLGYDTASTEGYDADKICQVLNLPISYEVVSLLWIGRLRGPDKYNGGRFSMQRTVFDGEYGKPMKL